MNQPITTRNAHDVGEAWNTVDAAELYEIARWGQGYFSIGDNGHVKIHPTKEPHRAIDLKQLIDHLQLRGINLPTLVRFTDILQHRLQDIHEAFQAAMTLLDVVLTCFRRAPLAAWPRRFQIARAAVCCPAGGPRTVGSTECAGC